MLSQGNYIYVNYISSVNVKIPKMNHCRRIILKKKRSDSETYIIYIYGQFLSSYVPKESQTETTLRQIKKGINYLR